MNIELVKLTGEYKEQLFDMLTEWKEDIIANHTDMSPRKILVLQNPSSEMAVSWKMKWKKRTGMWNSATGFSYSTE